MTENIAWKKERVEEARGITEIKYDNDNQTFTQLQTNELPKVADFRRSWMRELACLVGCFLDLDRLESLSSVSSQTQGNNEAAAVVTPALLLARSCPANELSEGDRISCLVSASLP